MHEFELREEIKELKHKLERYELEEVGIYTPKHVINTKVDFGTAIKENLREQKHYSNTKNLFSTTGRIQFILIQHFNFQCSELIKRLNGYNLQSVKLKLKDYANNFINICNEQEFTIKTQRLFYLKIEQAKLENDYIIFQSEEKWRKQEQARKIAEQRKADQEWFDRLREIEVKLKDSIFCGDIEETERLQQEIEKTRHLLRDRKAGWIYIISNDDMLPGYYKLGTTRRVNPLVRINELSDASHAFKFKVHAFIYTEDCFGLEAALHRRLAYCRVNKENVHKEFFHIDLDELQKILLDEFEIDVEMNEDIYEDDEKLNAIYNFAYDK